MIILRSSMVLNRTRKAVIQFEERFWSGADLGELYQTLQTESNPDGGLDRIFMAGFREFNRLRQSQVAPDALMSGVQRAMKIAVTKEQERIEANLSFLASAGSTAPYVGLFGTVVGVMNSFRGLANVHQTTLAAVAPGIAEALVTTAMGLVTAIPAVIAYNRFCTKIDRISISYETFSDEFIGILHRKVHTLRPVETV